MKIDTDKINSFLNNISRKRKIDCKTDYKEEDTLLKELIYHCADNLITVIDSSKISNKNIKELLLKKDISNVKTNCKEFNLIMKAYSAVYNDIINDMMKIIEKNKKFNTIDYLKDLMKENKVSNKKQKLSLLKMSKKNINITEDNKAEGDNTEGEDNTEGDNTEGEEDEDYEPYDDNDNTEGEDDTEDEDMFIKFEKLSGNTKKFVDELLSISKNNNNTAEIVDYFKGLNKKEQETSIEQLKNIINDNGNKMPYVFKILQTDIKITTKKLILSKIFTNSFTSSKNIKWINDVMKIPFGQYKGLDLKSIKPAKVTAFLNNLTKLMDNAVYGHDNAKKQIVHIMAQQISNPECQGGVIGIYGCPGNGKSSLIKEGIAKAMDRPFIFISLGGAQDSAFLDGHSFTYEGSIYGRIAQALMDAKCMNPIIYFDELDKVSTCHKGDEIINLLIHLIDPVQNKLFRDKYFYDIDLDLSKVTFIFSFNEPDKINYILRDRITLIETKYLSHSMKLNIASNYLIPSICKDVGITLNISNDIISKIVNNYTNEGGVRKLKEKLYKIFRELNHAKLTKTKIANISIKDNMMFNEVLFNELFKNNPKYIHLTVHKEDNIGMVNGLWANSLGQGGVLPIESVLIPAKKSMTIKATGSLGEVIKESIEVALSVAWNILDEGLKMYWMNKWNDTPECFHIHCPDGSTGKEGPSAGAAMTLAFYSRLTNRKINHTVAMTGEINLRGEVTEIGGLDEKLNAAKRAGALLVLIPKNNLIDFNNVIKYNPTLIDDNFKVITVENINEVINYALI